MFVGCLCITNITDLQTNTSKYEYKGQILCIYTPITSANLSSFG